MWFFMYCCYFFSLTTLLCLITGFVQSFNNFHIFNANHVLFIVFTSIMYSFTETLIIFFFVGTGVSIKEYTQSHKLDNSFHKRSIAVKRKIYPPLMMNILYMIILFVLVGGVDTHRVPKWAYQTLFIVCIFDYLRIKIIQNESFKLNTQIILEMSGITR